MKTWKISYETMDGTKYAELVEGASRLDAIDTLIAQLAIDGLRVGNIFTIARCTNREVLEACFGAK